MENPAKMSFQPDASRHEYQLKGWQKGFSFVFGILLSGFGIFFAWLAVVSSTNRDQAFFAIVSMLLIGVGAYMIARALRSRIILEGTRLSIRDPFADKSADLSEIEGYRTISTRNGSFMQLLLKEGLGNISVSRSFASDDYFTAWFSQFRDLDAQDRESLLQEISSNTELGATPDQRLVALKDAQNWNIFLSAILLIAALTLNFGKQPYRQFGAIFLALGPAAAFFRARRSPLLYAVLKKKSDPRTDLASALMISSFGFLFSSNSNDAHLVSVQSSLLIAALVAALYIYGYFSTVRRSQSGFGLIIALLFCALSYSYCFAFALNTLFDNSDAKTYQTTVLAKPVTHGKSTTYYLRLAAWGPITNVSDLQVSPRIYGSYAPGDTACLGLHPGLLHLPWYQLINCPANNPPPQP
jgi:hypothetical protein